MEKTEIYCRLAVTDGEWSAAWCSHTDRSCVSDHGEYTECHRVIQSITECHRVTQIKYRVSKRNIEYYRVT